MKWTLLILLLLTTGVIHHAQPELSAPRGMSSTQIINGLLSSNASLKDRAAFELKRMSAETAEKMGAELSRYGMRECQLVLACLAAADTTPAAMVALSALEKESHEVRTAA